MSKYNKHVSLILALLSAVGSLSFTSVHASGEIYQSPAYLSLKKAVKNGKKASIFTKMKFWEKGPQKLSVEELALKYYENEKVQNILKKAFELNEYAADRNKRDILSTKTLALCISCAARLKENLKEGNLMPEEIDLLMKNGPFHVIQGIEELVNTGESNAALQSAIAAEFIHQEKTDIANDLQEQNKLNAIRTIAGKHPLTSPVAVADQMYLDGAIADEKYTKQTPLQRWATCYDQARQKNRARHARSTEWESN